MIEWVRTNRRRGLAVMVAGLAVVASVPAGSNAHSSARVGALALNGMLRMTSTPTSCPPEAPPEATLCAKRLGEGAVRGLGKATEDYMFFVQEMAPCGQIRVLETPNARIVVPGKGELHLALARREECVPSALTVVRDFTITGGSGIYAGASGGGSVFHQAHYTLTGSAGNDTWTGTLNVPGLEFDVTPPTLTGTTPKTVRARKHAKWARVTYRVSARDEVDGSITASCHPKSGSRFRVGRTTVKCSATDNSANTRSAGFRVIVRRAR